MTRGVYVRTEETILKLKEASKKRYENPEQRQLLLCAGKKGAKLREGVGYWTGKKRPVDTRLKMSASHKGKLKGIPKTKEHRQKLSDTHAGDKHPNWKGGKSFEPYCIKFNERFKNRVRKFFGFVCVECGNKNSDGTKLHVHHVNFNKMSCCDGTKTLFVSLCNSCHPKTNFRRDFWEERYTKLIEEKYGGICYAED